MGPTGFERAFFDASSRVTSRFGRAGARALDRTLRPLIGNRALAAAMAARNRRLVADRPRPRKVLVLPDVHVGDAVLSQALVAAVRGCLPEAEIDFPVNRAAAGLLEPAPGVRVLPCFVGAGTPSSSDMGAIRALAAASRPDVVLNLSPFVPDRAIGAPGAVVNALSRLPAVLLRERRGGFPGHMISIFGDFVRGLWDGGTARPAAPLEVPVVLDDGAAERAARFASDSGIGPGRPGLMVHPDGGSRFSRLPLGLAAGVVRRIAPLGVPVLVTPGFTAEGAGAALFGAIPAAARRTVRIVPEAFELAELAALADACGVFLSGDTGLLHAAAARKRLRSGSPLRNRTAVAACFGATPPRLSGYDSEAPGFLPAGQDAPSRTFDAASPCRNITCVNKLLKTCREVKCFDGLEPEVVAGWIERRLGAA